MILVRDYFYYKPNILTGLPVYDISVLSNIPLAVSDLLASTAPPQRLRPLFSIGVHDIPLLEEDLRVSTATAKAITPGSEPSEPYDEPGCGWIACTTDSILAMKSKLYDVLITMPPAHSEDAAAKVWPKVESPQGVEMRATQRDLRRYQSLQWALSRTGSVPASPAERRRSLTSGGPDPPRTPLSNASGPRDEPMLDLPDTDSIIEPLSWSAVAYSGFMWWASSGEQRGDLDEEAEADAGLLAGLVMSPTTPGSQPAVSAGPTRNPGPNAVDMSAKSEMAIIAYFHRLTTQILTTLSDIVDATDSDDERDDELAALHQAEGEGDADENETGPGVHVSSEDVVRMGLDVWSATDHLFIEEIAREYFGRGARVEGRNVDVCGIRIC